MAAKRKNTGLGRGLDALFGEAGFEIAGDMDPAEAERAAGGATEISIDDIKPNAAQPRKTFDEDSLEELAESIKQHGLLQPVVVRPSGSGYEIVAGERRWRAFRMAGMKTVPCLIRDLTDEEATLFAIIENMQRKDLDPIEEAEGLSNMIETYGMKQEQVSKSVSKSRPYITNSLRLLKLPPEVREMVSDGRLSSGHGKAILSLRTKDEQIRLAEKIAKEDLSVRAAEALVSAASGKKKPKKEPAGKSSEIVQIEDELREKLGTKVSLVTGAKKGKIEIEYYGREELDRLIEILTSL